VEAGSCNRICRNLARSRNAATGGYALCNSGTGVGYRVNNSGTIVGNTGGATTGASRGSTVVNRVGGTFAPYDTIDLGARGRLQNAGTIEVSGVHRTGETELTGDLVQTETGRLRFDLDSLAGKVDHLRVSGSATIAGGFELVPTTLLPGSHEVLAADGGVTLTPGRTAETHLFAFTRDRVVQPTLAGASHQLSQRFNRGK
jgi:hypothetical protein